MRVLHQAGHNTVWNTDSFLKDGAGDGIIYSPVHIKSDKLSSADTALKSSSFFDPQFYIPDSQKTKLHSYEFFPERITDGYSTEEFEGLAYKSAELCLQYQLDNNFDSLIVPAKYFPEMSTEYIERQKAFTVDPFLSVIRDKGLKNEIYLTLPITIPMIRDNTYRIELLNWITSYQEIAGVYLLCQFNETSKQIQDFDKLWSYIEFTNSLCESGLKVILGYCNTEAILYTLLNCEAVTLGAYENTRNFSIDKFLEEDGERRGPAPRLYIPKLLNWLRFDTVTEIRQDHPELWAEIYTSTTYSDSILDIKPSFNKPELYKHHFCTIGSQLNELLQKDLNSRKSLVTKWVSDASNLYQKIDDAKVMFFDRNCSGDHLPTWNRILNKL